MGHTGSFEQVVIHIATPIRAIEDRGRSSSKVTKYQPDLSSSEVKRGKANITDKKKTKLLFWVVDKFNEIFELCQKIEVDAIHVLERPRIA